MPDATAFRVHIYDRLLATGLPPTIRELANHYGASEAEARRWIAELKIGKTILPHPLTGEIWMAGPFASAKTPYKVIGERVTWWANCAWDMLGIAMISGETVRIHSQCTDCDEPMTLKAGPQQKPDVDGVVHFLVPARHWYDDIGFT